MALSPTRPSGVCRSSASQGRKARPSGVAREAEAITGAGVSVLAGLPGLRAVLAILRRGGTGAAAAVGRWAGLGATGRKAVPSVVPKAGAGLAGVGAKAEMVHV